jgi:hypothetical protein
MTDILIVVFAMLLCFINAVVWTFVSDMPLVGIGWVVAGFSCIWLRRWSRGF